VPLLRSWRKPSLSVCLCVSVHLAESFSLSLCRITIDRQGKTLVIDADALTVLPPLLASPNADLVANVLKVRVVCCISASAISLLDRFGVNFTFVHSLTLSFASKWCVVCVCVLIMAVQLMSNVAEDPRASALRPLLAAALKKQATA
jgi:hypothetical protein